MGKYKLVNWQTLPFKRKSFEGQLERYTKCCVVGADNPDKVLDIIYLFGFDRLTEVIHERELGIGKEKLIKELEEPIDGEFVEVESHSGPLFRRYLKDEALYGICSEHEVGKAERLDTGKVKVYHSIKVFTHYIIDDDIGKKEYINGWFPDQMYKRYFGYRYIPLSDLTEPLQI